MWLLQYAYRHVVKNCVILIATKELKVRNFGLRSYNKGQEMGSLRNITFICKKQKVYMNL
jgi:hypothetical protein